MDKFVLPAVEPKEIAILDDIDFLPEQSSIRTRSHDLHGSLPEVTLKVDPADRLGAFNLLGREAVTLCAISRLRRELGEAFSGSTFLSPTTLDGKRVAGLQWYGRTVLAEAEDFVQAYHRLWRKAVRWFLWEPPRAEPARSTGDRPFLSRKVPLMVLCAQVNTAHLSLQGRATLLGERRPDF